MNSDFLDNASELEAMQREMAIKKVRDQVEKIKFTGYCRYCNEQISLGQFCSAECREDQEMADKLSKIKGFR